MTFIAQGIPLKNIINMVYVSSEIVHALMGCFGLILVASLTVCTGWLLFRKIEIPVEQIDMIKK